MEDTCITSCSWEYRSRSNQSINQSINSRQLDTLLFASSLDFGGSCFLVVSFPSLAGGIQSSVDIISYRRVPINQNRVLVYRWALYSYSLAERMKGRCLGKHLFSTRVWSMDASAHNQVFCSGIGAVDQNEAARLDLSNSIDLP